MRCDDLTRELARPTGAFAPLEVVGHLAACPACAGFASAAGRLDRTWEATRPADPSADALDDLWARASAEIDAREVPAILKFPGRRRRIFVGLVAAQAAALLLAAGLFLLRRDAAGPIELVEATTQDAVEPGFLALDVEQDQASVVRIDKDLSFRSEKLDLSRLYDGPSMPDDTPHDAFGAWETIASPFRVVASNGP